MRRSSINKKRIKQYVCMAPTHQDQSDLTHKGQAKWKGKCGNKYEKMVGDIRKWCSNECGYRMAAKKLQNKQEKDRLAEAKKTREQKIEMKTLTDWHNDLQKVINGIVKELDIGRPCIARPTVGGKRDSGHYYSVKSAGNLRHHLWNIHSQSVHSNQHKSGDPRLYMEGMAVRYGEAIANYLRRLHALFPEIRLTIHEIRYTYLPNARAILKNLKDGTYHTTDRFTINWEIGIYRDYTSMEDFKERYEIQRFDY